MTLQYGTQEKGEEKLCYTLKVCREVIQISKGAKGPNLWAGESINETVHVMHDIEPIEIIAH